MPSVRPGFLSAAFWRAAVRMRLARAQTAALGGHRWPDPARGALTFSLSQAARGHGSASLLIRAPFNSLPRAGAFARFTPPEYKPLPFSFFSQRIESLLPVFNKCALCIIRARYLLFRCAVVQSGEGRVSKRTLCLLRSYFFPQVSNITSLGEPICVTKMGKYSE